MMTLTEILNRYLAGERDFSNINSRVGILVNVDLSNINLSDATLDRVSLVDCNLSGANLSKANIPGSNLEDINLSQANLSQANFCVDKSTDYSQMIETMKANLAVSLENLTPEIAAQTMELMSEQMSQQLKEALLPVSLKRANLTQADLTQADLNDANLQEANLTNADLRKADLRGADLSNTNLTGVNFADANLTQANLTGAILDRTGLQKAALGWTIMPDGSVSKNPGLELIDAKLNPLKRKAWFPITVRQDGDLTASKFAGKPWLNVDESWIRCGCCQNQMRFFFQLNLGQVPHNLQGKFGSGILQLFYCVNCDDYAPFSPSNLVRIIHPQGKPAEYEIPHFKDNWSDDSLVRSSDGQFPAKIIVNWKEITDYPHWEDAESAGVTLTDEELKIILSASDTEESELDDFSYLNDEEREFNLLWQKSEIVHQVMYEAGMFFPSRGDKLAGYPRWVQDPEYPNCPVCDRLMNQLIFEFASDDNIPYLWGDVGTGYFVQCPEHKEQVTFLWQCG